MLLIRPDRNADDAHALSSAGFEVQVEPWLIVRPASDAAPAIDLAQRCAEAVAGDLLIITSPRTWTNWAALVDDLAVLVGRGRERGLTIMATGTATADTIPFADVSVASHASATGILADLADAAPATALLPASAISHPRLRAGLEKLGWNIASATVYETTPVEQRPTTADDVEAGRFDAIVARSPSAVTALLQHCPRGVATRVIAIGPSTSQAARVLPLMTEADLTSAAQLPEVVAAALTKEGN